MKTRITPRALAEAKRAKTWWLNNRQEAPELFEQENRKPFGRGDVIPLDTIRCTLSVDDVFRAAREA